MRPDRLVRTCFPHIYPHVPGGPVHPPGRVACALFINLFFKLFNQNSIHQ